MEFRRKLREAAGPPCSSCGREGARAVSAQRALRAPPGVWETEGERPALTRDTSCRMTRLVLSIRWQIRGEKYVKAVRGGR